MNYYYNEDIFLRECTEEQLGSYLVSFKSLYDAVEKNAGKLWIKENFSYTELISATENQQKYVLCLTLFGRCGKILADDGNAWKIGTVSPETKNEKILELLELCNRDKNEQMVSLPEDVETESVYQLKDAAIEAVYNLHDEKEIHEYRLHHPYPTSIKEVFEKIEEMYPEFVFTKHAYKTAAGRESAYRKTGYDTVLQTFQKMHELLTPFYLSAAAGKSEVQVFHELKEMYGIDISPESKLTMEQYGKQREVKIEGEIYQFTNHIKFNKDVCRIHFRYIGNKIYIGHAGKHLDTVSG